MINNALITSAISEVTNIVLFQNAKKATKYISPKLVVKATRKFLDKRDSIAELYITVGKPNYAERKFVVDCESANEPFPVKKIQIKA